MEVSEILGLLDIEPAATRQYLVHYKGEEIQSLCIGLSAKRGDLTFRTLDLSAVFQILVKWLRGDARFADFFFSSITINREHAAAIHRDSANIGRSVVRTLGNYEGGQLFWFPHDEGIEEASNFSAEQGTPLDTTAFQLFDGNKAHGVTPFVGSRMSVIYFTTCHLDAAKHLALATLLEWGALVKVHKVENQELSVREGSGWDPGAECSKRL